MKASQLPRSNGHQQLASRMVRRHEAVIYVKAPEMLNLLEAAGWVRPSINKHKLTLYDLNFIDQALDRLLIEPLPDSASSMSGSEGAR